MALIGEIIIILLYEGGFRIGELLNMKIKDLQFNEYGVAVTVNKKTGMRRVFNFPRYYQNNYNFSTQLISAEGTVTLF